MRVKEISQQCNKQGTGCVIYGVGRALFLFLVRYLLGVNGGAL